MPPEAIDSLDADSLKSLVLSLLTKIDELLEQNKALFEQNKTLLARIAELEARRQAGGTMIQAAWLWLKHQPKSAITRWFVQRTAGQSGRIRRIMIVAVARKLAIALWRFLKQGLVPQGAMLANR